LINLNLTINKGTIFQFSILLFGFLTPILLKYSTNDKDLSLIYSYFALSPFIDGSANALVFKKVNVKGIYFVQFTFCLLSIVLFDDILLVVFIFTRQLLLTNLNYYILHEEYKFDRHIRLYLGIQLFLCSLASFILGLYQSIALISVINLFLVIFSLNKIQIGNRKIQFEDLFSLGSIALIVGSFYIEAMFQVINKQYTILLIYGLQLINLYNGIYHFFRNKINIWSPLRILYEEYIPLFAIIISIFSVLLSYFFKSSETIFFIISFVVCEISITHLFVMRQKKNNFNFVYRLIVVVLIMNMLKNQNYELLIIHFMLVFFYYLITIIYGRYFILGSRSA
jgi:hypothetical protein